MITFVQCDIQALYPRKLRRIPAATADPITPATFGAMACIRRWLFLSNSRPTFWDTRAASGTAETPAFPIRGLILFSSLQNKFMNFTNNTPHVVATMKEKRPNAKILTELPVRNTFACVEHPTVTPMRIVTTSMSGPRAVSASLFVTPLSFRRFPKNSMPRSGIPDGTMKAVRMKPTIGKMIFSF